MDDNAAQHAQKLGSVNPRRIPASRSVSLKHPAPKSTSPSAQQTTDEDDSVGSSMEVDAASDAPVKPTCQKDSSGESSNPEKWFEKTNNNVQPSNASFNDDDPPFFLRNSSSENTPPEILQQRSREQARLENDALNLLNHEQGSSSEDFRSVIDDLTIENKRLKKRLKRYQRLHSSQLHTEALFELRVHGLPAQDKRELIDMLRTFVVKKGQTPQSSANMSSANISSDNYGVPSSLQPVLTSSSNSRVGDSGYASMSMSGRNTSSTTGNVNPQVKPGTSPGTANERRSAIQNYLLDIPAGLLPHQTGPMTEKQKKKVIVRRLEQLFAGRDPSAGGHQQPIQQDKIAQSAARADRRANETDDDSDFAEGSREARIMPKSEGSAQKILEKIEKLVESTRMLEQGTQTVNQDGTFEQRPTRPLDLDPYRAQIPAENMEYIRHLGFSPPDFEEVYGDEDRHGWIYLNVLHNMAQLHLTNVTVDFVRKAVADYSKKLEISPDGRKLRWKGRPSVTRTSSDNSPDQTASYDNPSESKRIGEGSKSSHHTSEGSGFTRQKNRLKFAYSPLFHREDSDAQDSRGDDDLIYQLSTAPGVSSVRASNSNAQGKLKRDDAPIIFYNNLGFYTDLSGDYGDSPRRKPSNYNRYGADPIGSNNETAKMDILRKLEYEKGPLSQSFIGMPSHDSTTPTSGSLKVVGGSKGSNSSLDTPDPMEFEASGLGGVFPADNFAISVRSRQQLENVEGYETPGTMRRKAYPMQIRRALQKQNSRSKLSTSKPKSTHSRNIVQREIIGSQKHELPASRLPEGTYFHNTSDEEDDEDDEMVEFMDEDDSTSDDIPLTAPQRVDWVAYAADKIQMSFAEDSLEEDQEEGEEEDDEDDDDDEGDDEGNDDDISKKAAGTNESEETSSKESIDLLATARAVDPEAIQTKEREFDGTIAERLRDEIPAGSSAATADGGSGFNSPATRLDKLTTASVAASLGSVPTIGASVSQGASKQRKTSTNLKRGRSDASEYLQDARATKSPKVDHSD